jgi:hypothetical protein
MNSQIGISLQQLIGSTATLSLRNSNHNIFTWNITRHMNAWKPSLALNQNKDSNLKNKP